jgi:hypothetical protein
MMVGRCVGNAAGASDGGNGIIEMGGDVIEPIGASVKRDSGGDVALTGAADAGAMVLVMICALAVCSSNAVTATRLAFMVAAVSREFKPIETVMWMCGERHKRAAERLW